MQKTILILTGGQLSLQPRVVKEASTLAKEGYNVIVGSVFFDKNQNEEDKELAITGEYQLFSLVNYRFFSLSILDKVIFRVCLILYQKFNLFKPFLAGRFYREMIAAYRDIKPDLVIFHTESGLVAANKLGPAKISFAFDFEDWHSEDFDRYNFNSKPIGYLKDCERFVLNQCVFSYTTSEVLAKQLYFQNYKNGKMPYVVRNRFSCIKKTKSQRVFYSECSEKVKFYWFSQVIGPNRGLETVSQAFSIVSGAFELYLRGNVTRDKQWVKQYVTSLNDKVYLLPRVKNSFLGLENQKFHVGLAVDEFVNLNRAFTITNKIYDYIRCGLPVVATDTPGNREVFKQFGDVGWLVKPHCPESMAETVSEILRNPIVLEKKRANILSLGDYLVSSQDDERKILNLVNSYFESLSNNNGISIKKGKN